MPTAGTQASLLGRARAPRSWLLAASAALLGRPLASAEPLPNIGSIIGAYGNWNQCDDQMFRTAEAGANVLFWFAADLVAPAGGPPEIATGLDLGCVANVSRTLRQLGLPTTHVLSIGGWCARHPDTKLSGVQWFAALDAWNPRDNATGARLFDGLDWDIEGCSMASGISLEVLDLMGEMSVAAKAAGYVVTMAPAQSYLDVQTSEFNLQLNNPPADPWMQDFLYAGRNTYAYLLAHFGADTFDLVDVQFYEGWSRAHYAITNQSVPVGEYLDTWLGTLAGGWQVDFAAASRPPASVAVSPERVLVGTHIVYDGIPPKFQAFTPSQLQAAWASLQAAGRPTPRGVMFWCVACGDGPGMAAELNGFLHVRPPCGPRRSQHHSAPVGPRRLRGGAC